MRRRSMSKILKSSDKDFPVLAECQKVVTIIVSSTSGLLHKGDGIMGRFKTAAFTAPALVLLLGMSGTETHKLCEGFLPANTMKIPVGDHSVVGLLDKGITEAQYTEVMDRIENLYTNVVKTRGGRLVVNRLWDDSTVNSSAEQQGSDWIINMYGGIARHPDTTFEGEALIACHEMGHHLGGAPKMKSVFGGGWATNEGGADYFATLKCLREFFAKDDNAAIVAAVKIDPTVKTQCEAQFTDASEQALCKRISLSGESVAYLFQDLSRDTTRPQFSTPDKKEVSKTNDEHPATQCRMDTYFAGSVCQVALSQPQSDSDFKVGSCVQGTDSLGWRPRCWFSPTTTGGGGGGGGDDGGGGGGGDDGGNCPLGSPSLCDMACKLKPSLPFCKK